MSFWCENPQIRPGQESRPRRQRLPLSWGRTELPTGGARTEKTGNTRAVLKGTLERELTGHSCPTGSNPGASEAFR